MPDTQIGLTVRGVAECERSGDDLVRFVRALAHIGQRATELEVVEPGS